MLRSYRKVAIAVGAMAAGFGSLRGASAAPVLIENDESAIVDGWNITAPAGVALTVTTSGNTIDIEKAANFTGPYESLQVAFQPVAGASGPATSIDFTNETILDNTGSPFNGFSFLLLNIGGVNATFSGDIFVNAIGPTPGSLDGALDSLAYVGTQADDLYISAPAGSAFTLDEVPSLGGGVVPIPAAAWQSLVGLAGLGVVGTVRRRLKLRRLA
jgi:hypothetical protein